MSATWTGRASTDSAAYRIVREFRAHVGELAFAPLVERVRQVDPEYSFNGRPRRRGPLWALVSERPMHLLDPKFKTWTDLLVAAADLTAEDAQKAGGFASLRLGPSEHGTHQAPVQRGHADARTAASTCRPKSCPAIRTCRACRDRRSARPSALRSRPGARRTAISTCRPGRAATRCRRTTGTRTPHGSRARPRVSSGPGGAHAYLAADHRCQVKRFLRALSRMTGSGHNRSLSLVRPKRPGARNAWPKVVAFGVGRGAADRCDTVESCLRRMFE